MKDCTLVTIFRSRSLAQWPPAEHSLRREPRRRTADRLDHADDPNRFFFRSDHYNYARKGIPIIFFFDGEHEDYHRPGDEAQKIDYEKMEKVARTIYMTLWEVAGLKERPKVDKPLPAQLQR